MSEKLSATELVELCEKMRALGVQAFEYEGLKVGFYPPEPAYSSPTPPIETRQGERKEPDVTGTEAERRARVRAELANEDLYASA